MNEAMWALTHYGYLALFVLLSLGIIGMPIPDETLMVLAGSMTANGPFHFAQTFMVCIIGSMIGMLVSYTIGSKVGKPILDRYGKWIKLTPARVAVVERWFAKYGSMSIVLGYFVPGIRHLTSYFAGVTRLNMMVYLLAAGVGNILWVGTFLTLGHLLGVHWETTIMWLKRQWLIALCILMMMIAAAVVVYVLRLRRRKLLSE